MVRSSPFHCVIALRRNYQELTGGLSDAAMQLGAACDDDGRANSRLTGQGSLTRGEFGALMERVKKIRRTKHGLRRGRWRNAETPLVCGEP